MLIRLLTSADLLSCSKLYAEVFSLPPWNEPWSEAAALERLSHFYHCQGFVGFIAHEDSLKGFVLGNREPLHSGQIFYLREMCVDAKKQNTGCGSQLLGRMQDELSLHAVRAMYLTTEREIDAAAFYQKRDFKYSESMGFYVKPLLASKELN